MDTLVSTNIRPKVEGQSLKIAETVLKRRHYNTNLRAERATKVNALKKSKVKKHPKLFRTAQSLIKAERLRILDARRQKYLKRNAANVLKRTDNRVLFVVRNDRVSASTQTKNTLKSLGLNDFYSGIFLKNSDESMKLLKTVDRYVFYGWPSFEIVRNLFLKSAAIKVKGSGKRSLICDNTIVEEQLGSLGLICVGDLIDEIWSGGEHFSSINKALWPFKLNNLKKAEGVHAKRYECGNMGLKINEKLEKII